MLVVLFVLNEQRHSNPLVPLSIFKIKGLAAADVTQILAMAGFYTMFFLLTLYMQEVLHYSAIHAGLCYLPVTVGAGVGAGVATNAIPKIGTRPVIAAGALLGAAGVFWLSRIPVDGTYLADLLPGNRDHGVRRGPRPGGRPERRQRGCAGRQGRTRRVADHRVLPARGRVGARGLHLARHEPHRRSARDAIPRRPRRSRSASNEDCSAPQSHS